MKISIPTNVDVYWSFLPWYPPPPLLGPVSEPLRTATSMFRGNRVGGWVLGPVSTVGDETSQEETVETSVVGGRQTGLVFRPSVRRDVSEE